MLQVPFYDPNLSYEDNYEQGPFGAFVEGKAVDPGRICGERSRTSRETQDEPGFNFLGQKVNLPFGIPAGPLINSNFCKSAFEKGFDICVYKTVRSTAYPCHAFPNILSVKVEGDLTVEKAQNKLTADNNYSQPLSITNSFGVPSKDSAVWQEDCKKAISYAGPGQVLVLSFMGTVKKDQTQREFVEDYILAARLAKETGAKILEANLSCPNIGNEGLVCYNLEVTKAVAKGIRKVIGNTPLILKIGYYRSESDLKNLAQIANEYANDIAGINTLPAVIVDKEGGQALPGPHRTKSGVCGSCIKWAGIEAVQKLAKIRSENHYKFTITGVGGVSSAKDYLDYQKSGADSVMSATGSMWNPYLAQEIQSSISHE